MEMDTAWPGGRMISTVNALSKVNAGLLLSETRIRKLEVATAVGVPPMVAPESESPAGNDPDRTLNVYGPVPPDALRVCE